MRKSLSTKKKDEAESVSLLFSSLHIDSNACDWTSERPDCKYTTPSGKVIGIEIVRCINQDDEVLRMQNDLYKACKFCEKDLRKSGFGNMIIWVVFRYSLHRSSAKDPDFCNIISKEIARHLIYDNYPRNKDADKELYKKLKKEGAFNYKYVESISIITRRNDQLDIEPVLMYSLPIITEASVTQCIRAKNEKLKDYSKLPCNSNISEFWLAIAIPWNAFTQIGNLPEFSVDSEYAHIFITDPYEYKQLK